MWIEGEGGKECSNMMVSAEKNLRRVSLVNESLMSTFNENKAQLRDFGGRLTEGELNGRAVLRELEKVEQRC